MSSAAFFGILILKETNEKENTMRNENMDREWSFALGQFNGMASIAGKHTVNLPHDYMIENDVKEDAPAGPATGYYNAGVAHYTKMIMIPESWKDEVVFLKFDGIMMNATVEINGCRAALQHYGYAPFVVDITPYIYWGKENRLTITTNPSMQPNSRWYSGAGIFRSVELVHTPLVSIANDGIFGYTKNMEFDEHGNATTAYLQTEVIVSNQTNLNQIAMVEVFLTRDGNDEVIISRKQKIQINPNSKETASTTITLDYPVLWSAEEPNLYNLHARVTALGTYGAHFIAAEKVTTDETSTLFGIRTITADVKHGLRVNGKSVKLKGGCLHHDNGVIGAVSLYDSEARKLKKLQEIGFNAIRTTHNPPSSALMEACDRLGMYVFDEAFDVWGMMKQPGDYSMFFDTDWKKDLEAFVKRDRNHPSVVIWSTGNEIVERGGLNNGYSLATEIANHIHSLDCSRPVSNGICSFWCGLDDQLNAEQYEKKPVEVENAQNFDFNAIDTTWEERSEAFTNGLDIVGYNYMEDKYTTDHELYPERIILGSENFPKEIGKRWPMVENTPYVLGDFTWTAWDYIGEAGIGKAISVEADDPILQKGPYSIMTNSSTYPWRTANDADVDINGTILTQGKYRSVVWGSIDTHIFSYNPEHYRKVEMTSMWGFTAGINNWNWPNAIGSDIKLLVFSRAEEVEVFVNGASIGRKKQGESLAAEELPLSFIFDTTYHPGEVIAISYTNGKEISRDTLKTTGAPCAVSIRPEVSSIAADGHSLAYVSIEILDADGNVVPTDEFDLSVTAEGAGELLGFGSANPITKENYTTGKFKSYRGRALAVVRSGYESGSIKLHVSSEALGKESIEITTY